MQLYSFYTFCAPFFFETLNQFPASTSYRDLIAQLLSDDWEVNRFDIWVQARPKAGKVKRQGFKIHVSATAGNAEEMLRRVVPECAREGVTFKAVADARLVRFLCSKRYARAGSGKFITIYPSSNQSFLRLIDAIHEATRDLEGPYILSDRRYGESKVVFYRYGAFQRMYQLNPDGARIAVMEGTDGSVIQDDRTPFFQLPEGIRDILPDENPSGRNGPLNDRYQVQEALGFTNTGGVYQALDQNTGDLVVLKEARPHTLTWLGKDDSLDAVSALHLEHRNLGYLQGLECVPKLIDFFQEWEHTFLVISFVEGVSLANLRATEEFVVLAQLDDLEKVLQFCRSWRSLVLGLIDILVSIHERGVIFGDLSPTNVLRNEESGSLSLIDFEGAYVKEAQSGSSKFASQWFNPGFRHPDRREEPSLEPFDDFYGAAMLLYSLVCPVQTLFELDREHSTFRVLDYFVESGLPSEVRRIIQALTEGKSDRARDIAENWVLPSPSS